MARVMATEVLEQKIEKAQDKVKRTKKVYDEAVRELQILLDKRSALRTDEIMKAIANRPAVSRAIGVTFMALGVSESSSCSRMPAKSTSARAKPMAVQNANHVPVPRP